jgi:ABC-type uncharacterized transport system involved in gliding motility auxiliary subunit
MATPGKTQPSSPKPQVGRGGAKAAESIGFLAIIAVVLVLANVAGFFLFTRIDLTPNKIFTLSQGSRRLVSDLEDDLTINVYYTADLPAPWNAHERYLRDILDEYVAAGNGHVKLHWVDPDEEDEKQAAREAGIEEQVLGAQDTTSLTVRRGFVGLSIEHLGEHKTISFSSPSTEGLEYEISSRIQQLVQEPLPVGVVSGHGSPTLSQGLAGLRSAMPSYSLQEVDLSEEIDHDLKALLIIDPTEPFTPEELQRINQYVMNGGSLGVFGGAINLQLQGGMGGPSASIVDTHIDQLLQPWGVELDDGMVADAQAVRIPMRTAIGLPAFVPFPPIPRIAFDDEAQEHPVTFRVPYAPFFFTAPIKTNDHFHGTVLGRSSAESSWLLTGDSIGLTPRDPREWASTMNQGAQGPFDVLVALEGQLPSAFADAAAVSTGQASEHIEAPAQSTRPVRVLVSGTGTMMRDEFVPRGQEGAQQLTEGLILALNAVDWLAQDADLIAVRAKSIEEPPIRVPETIERAQQEAQTAQANAEAGQGDEQEMSEAAERLQDANEAWDDRKLEYQVALSAGLPLFIALAGLIRWQMRKRKRANLQQLRKSLAAKQKR